MPPPAGNELIGLTPEEGQPPEQADERQEPERSGLTDEERRSLEELKREVFGPRCC